jgi:ligand-binding sensor protein
MLLTDLMNAAEWEALERELSVAHNVSVNVYDPDGYMVTDFIHWANRVCPVVKENHQSTQAVCSIASQNAIAECRRKGESCIIACDAGFCKITTPIVVNGEFAGVLGLCGPLLEDEVETFYLAMLTGREEADLAVLAQGLQPISEAEARRLAGVLEARVAMLLASLKA